MSVHMTRAQCLRGAIALLAVVLIAAMLPVKAIASIEFGQDAYGQYYKQEGYRAHALSLPGQGGTRNYPSTPQDDPYGGGDERMYFYMPSSMDCSQVYSRLGDDSSNSSWASDCTVSAVSPSNIGNGCGSSTDDAACMQWSTPTYINYQYKHSSRAGSGYVYTGWFTGTMNLYGKWCSVTAPVVNGNTCTCPGVVSNGKCRPHPNAGGTPLRQNSGNPDPGTCPICTGNQTAGNNSGGGDPIQLVTGNMFHSETDVSLPGGLSFTRAHNSSGRYGGRLGNWRGEWLIANPAITLYYSTAPEGGTIQNVTAYVYRPDGRALIFTSKRDSATSRYLQPWVSGAELEFVLETIQPETTGAWTGLRLFTGGKYYEIYNTALQLISIRTPGPGGTLVFNVSWTAASYAGKVSSVTDWHGNALGFTYSSQDGMLASLSVNGQLWASYGYDANSRLSSVIYADGTSRSYAYESASNPFALTKITDERGLVTHEWVYGSDGKGIQSKLGGGTMQTDIVRNADGTVTETLPNGLQNIYTSTTISGRSNTSRKERYEGGIMSAYYDTSYDASGNAVSERDWMGNVTQRTFNSRNQEISRTEAYGTVSARTVTTDWDSLRYHRRPIKITTPVSEEVRTYTNADLTVRTTTDLTVWAAGSRTTTYAYNATGLITSVDGPRTDVSDITTYAYTPTLGRLASVTNALNQVTTFGNHTVIGLPQTMTDPNGNVTNFTYDARGRLLTSTFVDPVQGNLVTAYAYDAAGNLVTVTLPDFSTVNYEYNANNDVMAVEDATGARIEYERDLEGNITRTHVRDAGGYLVRRVDQAWDAMKRLVSVTGVSALRAAWTYDANGNRTSATDALNNTTLSAFDALDRLVSSTDAINAVTQFTHDAEGNLASVTDARGLTTSYEYDGLGCLRRQTSPDTGVTTFACDKAGNITSKTDARGITVTYGYDALNRRTSASYAGAPAELALYGYDATAGGNEGIGRLTAAQNDGADIALTYDARGNVIADTRTIAGHTYTTQYSYDAAGRVYAMTYPSGRTVNYVHNTAGQVTAINTQAPGGSAQTVLTGITWEPFGPASSFTYGNGLAENRSYDADGYLTQIAVNGTAGTLLSRIYSRDVAGRITAIADGDPLRSETYAYDNVDRLTTASGPYGARGYGYDAVGNRTTQSEDGNASSYAYGSTSNRLYQVTGADAASLDYDATGNTTIKGDRTFAYNAANRLAGITLPGEPPETVTFTYSALGERVSKTSSLGATHFHYDRAGHLIAETDATGTPVREYIWLGDTPVGLIAIRNAGTTPELFAVHTDHLATTLAITDSAQLNVWQYSREPFGELVAGNNTVRWPLRFPGQYEDQETGIFYNYFRDYDASTGRYIESDPIGLDGGANTYAYVNGGPVEAVDPLGHMGVFINLMLRGAGAQALRSAPAAVAGGRALQHAASATAAAGAGALGEQAYQMCTAKDGADGDCGPMTRAQALAEAYAFAGIPEDGGACEPLTWADYRNKGRNYSHVRQQGAKCMGHRGEGGKPKVEDHPDGHNDSNQPHHACPHVHATNSLGQKEIFLYRRGT